MFEKQVQNYKRLFPEDDIRRYESVVYYYQGAYQLMLSYEGSSYSKSLDAIRKLEKPASARQTSRSVIASQAGRGNLSPLPSRSAPGPGPATLSSAPRSPEPPAEDPSDDTRP